MIDRNIQNIYTKVLKEEWSIKNVRNVGGVYVVLLRNPDRTDGKTVWLVPPEYRALDINYSAIQQDVCV